MMVTFGHDDTNLTVFGIHKMEKVGTHLLGRITYELTFVLRGGGKNDSLT